MEEGEEMKLSVHIKKQLTSFLLNVHFEVEKESFALLGASGCGKSMTLKCIAGIETPDEGYISINDHVVFDSSKGINVPIQERKIGFVFQNYALFPNMSVRQNIACGIHEKKKKRHDEVNKILKKYDLEELKDEYPSRLSGGQQQRTAFARTMASKPEILLLDEPFSALDKTMKMQMLYELVNLLKTFSGIIIYVSHDNDEVYQIANRVAILDQGHIVEIGDKKELFHKPTTRATAIQAGIENISPIVRMSEHRVYAMDWAVELEVDGIVSETCTHIAIPSYAILGSEKEQVNSLHIHIQSEVEHIHHSNAFVKQLDKEQKQPLLCRSRVAVKGYIVLPKEALCLLE